MSKKQQKTLSKNETIAIAALVVCVIGSAIGFGMVMSSAQEKEIHDTPLADQKAKHPTHLKIRGPAPQQGQPLKPAPADCEYVEYESPAGKLGAWMMRPPNAYLQKERKYPAVLYGHGGFAVGTSDATMVLPLVSSGYIVMIPAWRGENGNPGNFEMCYGEVEDAAAALEYLKNQPDVNADYIYAGGHSAGATIVSLLAETAPGLKKVVACGAYPNMREGAYEGAPFNPTDIYETELRAPSEHVKFLTCPLLLLYGDEDEHYIAQAKLMKKEAQKLGKNVDFSVMQGKTHQTALGPAITRMLDEFK